MLALAHAVPYGSGRGGYGAPAPASAPSYRTGDVIASQAPSVLYDIPSPSAWNISPARPAGPVLIPVDAQSISGYGPPSSLTGISSQPRAIATAASANLPLNVGSYKLLIVPSYEVPNIVGPEPALPAAGGNGGQSSDGYNSQRTSY